MFIVQSRPTLCDPMNWRQSGSSVHGLLQTRTLEWVAISFSTDCGKIKEFGKIAILEMITFDQNVGNHLSGCVAAVKCCDEAGQNMPTHLFVVQPGFASILTFLFLKNQGYGISLPK